MNERPFKEKSLKPSEEKLVEVLGWVSQHFLDLEHLTKNYKHSWNYSKSSGWMEKVEERGKALFYLIPLTDSFIISMAIRESERELVLSNTEYASYHKIVSSAKKYSEGYNVKFEITDGKTYDFSREFVKIIMSQR